MELGNEVRLKVHGDLVRAIRNKPILAIHMINVEIINARVTMSEMKHHAYRVLG